jgi:aminoglycoside phosphotransferase (APT) family kinase protein
VPTTLPTFDDLIGTHDVTLANVAERLLDLARAVHAPHGHVFTLHAELEGMRLFSQFETLLAGWQRRGLAILSLGAYLDAISTARIPHHVVTQASVEGRVGPVAVQGAEFLAR